MTTTNEQINQTVHDPICHTEFDIRDAAARTDFEGHTYFFHSGDCQVRFEANPQAALEAESSHEHVAIDDLPDTVSETGMRPDGSVALSNPSPTQAEDLELDRLGEKATTGGSTIT